MNLHRIPPFLLRAPNKYRGQRSESDRVPWSLNNRDRLCLKAGWYTDGFQCLYFKHPTLFVKQKLW